MLIRVCIALLSAFLALGGIAFADCDASTNPPVPLAIYLTPQGVFPAVPQQFGAAMRGSCVGTPDYAPATQPFTSAYPYPGSWWVFGPFPPQPYRGT